MPGQVLTLASRHPRAKMPAFREDGGFTMRTACLAAAAAFSLTLLGGCGKSDSGPKSMDEAKEEAAKLERPRPGQYKQVMTVTEFEVPGAPPEMAAQFKTAMQQSQESGFCLTEKMAADGFRDMFQKVGENGDCRYDRFEVSGGKLDALLQCANKQEGKAAITLAGTVGAEGSDITVRIDQQGGQAPMTNARIGMHLVSQRTGDCAAGG